MPGEVGVWSVGADPRQYGEVALLVILGGPGLAGSYSTSAGVPMACREFSSLELASKNEPRQDAMCNSCLTSLATISCLVSSFKAAVSFRVNSAVPPCLTVSDHRSTGKQLRPQRHRKATLLVSVLFGLKHEGSSGLKKCEGILRLFKGSVLVLTHDPGLSPDILEGYSTGCL